jgi:hypothetical protein
MTPKRTTSTRSMSRRARPAPAAAPPTAQSLGAAPAPAALKAGEAAESGLQVEGFIVIKIGDEEFTLQGKVGAAIIVSYHKPFDEALPLGTLPQMIGAVAAALGVPDAKGFQDHVKSTLDDMGKVPVLGGVVKMLSEGVFKITDLGINTQTGTYEFGFGVDTSATVNNIPIAAFGVKLTYVAPRQPS